MKKDAKIVLATRNKNKVREIKAVLAEAGLDSLTVLSLDDIGYSDEIVEDGETFSANAYIKASVPAKLGYYGLADDSGLEVDYLLGGPGVYSARYAGEPCNDENNNQKLLEELEDVPYELRTARYVSVISFVSPDSSSESAFFRGEVNGIILNEYHGNGGFGYDPLFFVPELKKTFAEVTMEEKNAISHRGKSMRQFAAWLKSVIED